LPQATALKHSSADTTEIIIMKSICAISGAALMSLATSAASAAPRHHGVNRQSTSHSFNEASLMQTTLTAAVLALSATLTLVSMPAAADLAVGGDETNVDRVIPSAAVWTILTAEPFQTMANDTHCIATGSADALNPNMADDSRYRFVLSVDNQNPAINAACERTVEFDTHGTDAQHVEEVSSTCTFRHLGAGNHTIYWLARKVGAATPNLTVDDNSMTFVCMNNLLDNDGEADGGGD
jgi:hypothetical protein